MDKELIKYGLVCLLTILLNVANLVALCTSQNPFTWVIIIVVYFCFWQLSTLKTSIIKSVNITWKRIMDTIGIKITHYPT